MTGKVKSASAPFKLFQITPALRGMNNDLVHLLVARLVVWGRRTVVLEWTKLHATTFELFINTM